jgi:hypothetical protein
MSFPGRPDALAEGPCWVEWADAKEGVDAGDEPNRRLVLPRLPGLDGLCGHPEFCSHVELPKPAVEAPALEVFAEGSWRFRIAALPGFFAS